MNKPKKLSKKSLPELQKVPLLVLLVPALVSFIIVTLVALLFITRS